MWQPTAAMTRDDFMRFFRDDESLATLTTDDRIEIFMEVLPGSSDITAELIEKLLKDYCGGGNSVISILSAIFDELRQ